MSKSYRSFADYLQDKYYNDIFRAIKDYMFKHKNSLGLWSYTVLDPSYISLEDIHVRGVSFHGGEGPNIIFRAAVEADIVLKGIGRKDYEADDNTVWFSVEFIGHLLEGLRMVTITSVETYSKDRFNKEDSLSKYLVPYLYAANLDDAAERFLTKYYPDALKEPMPLDLDEIIFAMCLTVYKAPLSDQIFGRSYFAEADVEVYDDDSLTSTHIEHIDRGTILINPFVVFMRNIGSENNTIIHECIHHDRHDITSLRKQGYGYQKIANAIGCSKNTVSSYCRRLDLETTKAPERVCLLCGKQMASLQSNVYVVRVTTQFVYFSSGFKERFYNEYLSGKKPKKIIKGMALTLPSLAQAESMESECAFDEITAEIFIPAVIFCGIEKEAEYQDSTSISLPRLNRNAILPPRQTVARSMSADCFYHTPRPNKAQRSFFRCKELSRTAIEEKDMAAEAIVGFITPQAATGMHIRL